MWLAILLSVGAVTIGIVLGLRQGKINRQLMDEGRIVQRKYVITEQAEEFTLRGADVARVLQGIQTPTCGEAVYPFKKMMRTRCSSLTEATGKPKCIAKMISVITMSGIFTSPTGKPTVAWYRSIFP